MSYSLSKIVPGEFAEVVSCVQEALIPKSSVTLRGVSCGFRSNSPSSKSPRPVLGPAPER
jgi:hypothetical protein